jgi:glycosyltransferase involved in cell wall biosynthesis
LSNQSNKISIGLPVFNGGKYLENAIKSLLSQTYQHFELIISDNCSTDETSLICSKYVQLDSRLVYIKQNANIGAYNNFIFTLNQAKYEYFMWAAADDEWHIDFLKHNLLNLTTNNKVVVSFSGIECKKTTSDFSEYINLSRINEIDNKFELIKELLTQKKYNLFIYGLFKKDILRQCFSHHTEFIDRWLLLPIVISDYKIALTDEVLYYRAVYDQKIHERHNKSSKIDVSYYALFKSAWNSSSWVEKVLNINLSFKENLYIKYYSLKFACIKYLKYFYGFFVIKKC